MRGGGIAALAVLGLGGTLAAPVTAQRTHVLLVTGLAGELQYGAAFHAAASVVYEAAKTRWGVADSSLVYLADDPARDPARIRGRATKESVAQALLALSHRVVPGDLVLVYLVGHGSGEGPDSRINLPGPDPTARDFAAWLAEFAKQTVVFVNASSASGDFVAALTGPNRVVVTATRSALERNETVFAEHFSQGLTVDAADLDKDGRVSVLEAFEYAKREVARAYESSNRLLTEHAQLNDQALARTVAFGGAAASADPRVAALLAERQALEAQVAELRTRKASMDSTAYERELERLLVEIAEKTRAIRAVGGPP